MTRANSVEVVRGEETAVASDEFEGNNGFDADEADEDEFGLQGRIRITTRCLWTDSGKLLDSLQRAADVALSSCRKDARLATVERQVGAILRKVVQKYSNRRPDVIVIATEAANKVITGSSRSENQNQNDDKTRSFRSNKFDKFSRSARVAQPVPEPVQKLKKVKQVTEQTSVTVDSMKIVETNVLNPFEEAEKTSSRVDEIKDSDEDVELHTTSTSNTTTIVEEVEIVHSQDKVKENNDTESVTATDEAPESQGTMDTSEKNFWIITSLVSIQVCELSRPPVPTDREEGSVSYRKKMYTKRLASR